LAENDETEIEVWKKMVKKTPLGGMTYSLSRNTNYEEELL